MAVTHVQDPAEFLSHLESSGEPLLVGFFGAFSEASRAARPEFERFCARHPDQTTYLVDLAAGGARELATRFGVSAVPAVLRIQGGRVLKSVIGAQSAGFYERALSMAGAATPAASARGEKRAAPSHRVLVYTTDTCPWCVRVKTYLKQNAVPFQEINVSRDPRAAERMVAKSGQQGVPQLDIDGRVVVGFDKARIDGLLGLSATKASA